MNYFIFVVLVVALSFKSSLMVLLSFGENLSNGYIVLVRIDERLLHGQIRITWGNILVQIPLLSLMMK